MHGFRRQKAVRAEFFLAGDFFRLRGTYRRGVLYQISLLVVKNKPYQVPGTRYMLSRKRGSRGVRLVPWLSHVGQIDHPGHLDHLDNLDNLDNLDHLNNLDNLDHLDHLDLNPPLRHVVDNLYIAHI